MHKFNPVFLKGVYGSPVRLLAFVLLLESSEFFHKIYFKIFSFLSRIIECLLSFSVEFS